MTPETQKKLDECRQAMEDAARHFVGEPITQKLMEELCQNIQVVIEQYIPLDPCPFNIEVTPHADDPRRMQITINGDDELLKQYFPLVSIII